MPRLSEYSLQSVSHEADNITASHQVWLDCLPLEVCTRISSILPSWELCKWDLGSGDIEPFPAALELAAVSDYQRRAVAAEKSHVIRIERSICGGHLKDLLKGWHKVLGDDIREIHLPIATTVRLDQDIAHLFSLPSITRATIPHLPALLNALKEGRSVKQLEVEFIFPLRNEDEGGDMHLLQVFQSCPVEELRLVCALCICNPNVQCPAANFLELLKGKPARVSLRSLEVVCYGRKLQRLCRTASIFPNLQRMSLQHWLHGAGCRREECESDKNFHLAVSKKMKGHLRRLKSVGVINCGKVENFAQIFGGRLTSITSQEMVSARTIRSLENCPNLISIAVQVARGAERYFPTSICSLRSLSLKWPNIMCAHEKQYSAPPEVLVGLVQRNTELQELALENIDIPPAMLEEILKTVGERLRRVHLPLYDSRESPKNRLLRVIRLMMKYNRNVTYIELHLSGRDYATGCKFHDYDECYNDELNDCKTCDFWRRAEKIVNVVTRHLPMLGPETVNQLRWFFGMYDRMQPSCPVM